jgi:glycosyltransferase involved in cell wall biosynthesis
MGNKLSYMLYSGKIEGDKRLFVGGLFQWVTAFERYGKFGEMNSCVKREIMENFDIVHVNYTARNATYLSALREELGEHSSTKLVANVDYGTMMWNKIDPFVMKDQLSRADHIFHVETEGADRLEKLLNRNVSVIPHPINIEDIKKGVKRERVPIISCQYHRYADTWCEYYYGLMGIRQEYDIDIILMNYSPPDGKKIEVPLVCMFNDLTDRMNYPQYIEYLSRMLINVDVTYDHTYGRGVVEAAALKVPTIGSTSIEAIQRLYPELAISPGSDEMMRNAVRAMLDDDETREKVAQRGFEDCDFYSQQHCYEMMKEMVTG